MALRDAFPAARLWRMSILGAIAAMVTYRFGQQKIERTVLPSGRYFEDTRDASGKRRGDFRYSTNPATGQPVITMSELIRPGMPGALPGKSGSPPLHSHRAQTECFTVKKGSMGYVMQGWERLVVSGTPKASQPVCIEPGVQHTNWNAANATELDLDITLEPPLEAEKFFRTLAGLALDTPGGLNNVGTPQMLSTFAAGGLALEEYPKPVWRLFEDVVVPYVINGILGISSFPAEYIQTMSA